MIGTAVSALFMGLLGGAHCVAMCGGASAILCGTASPLRKTAHAPAGIAGTYNAGRITGYALLGAAAGSLGAIPLGSSVEAFRFGLRTLAAICMLGVGLHLVGLPSFVRGIERIGGPIWRRILPLASRLVPIQSHGAALLAGVLWAFMPCGLLYGALALAASAASAGEGALTMAAFGLGTLPLMLTVTTVAKAVSRGLGLRWVRRAAGMTVLAFGLWNTAGLAQQATTPHHACCPHR